jgi:hypothetical protein
MIREDNQDLHAMDYFLPFDSSIYVREIGFSPSTTARISIPNSI